MTLRHEDLSQFTGSENWYQHSLLKSVFYTDGAKYVAQRGKAYWLLDLIASAQCVKKVKQEEFQVWTLKVNDHKGVITADDGDGRVIYSQKIEFTDFPLDEIKFYFVNSIILLPSEY
jgi:hypothetical protein